MFRVRRVAVPLTLDCNLHCKYCYRDKEKINKIPDFTLGMINYLGQLSPAWCEAFDKVKELFSYIPKTIHKKILSNCTLLTQEIVDYINENEIELLVSHDGPKTKFLRGVDVLADEKTVSLIRQVKIITVSSVITKYNVNVWENYFDIVKKLKRIDFQYFANPVNDVVPEQHYLVEGFDYETWFMTYKQFCVSPFSQMYPWYEGKSLASKRRRQSSEDTRNIRRYTGFNILPDGTVTGMIHVGSIYGSVVTDKYQDCDKVGLESGLMDYCIKSGCKYADRCHYSLQHTSEHTCTCRRLMMDKWGSSTEEAKHYVKEHINDIIEKYFLEFVESGYFDNKNMEV